MSRLLMILLLFISSVSFSQDPVDTMLRRSDSLRGEIRKSEAYTDSMRRKEDIDRMTSNSVNAFVRYQKEQKEKERKKAILYIGLGVFFLVVLVVGLRRRTKK